ncbi:hypothetical protein [Aestuariivirga sp.]|uniref:hypothetical protein n=1 Tax=Aestuariivirga sp. TaxID=2650926 RepID=UPI00391A2623
MLAGPVVATAAIVLATASTLANDRHALNGLFCNTKAQVEMVFKEAGRGIPFQGVVEMVNQDKVVCVHATKVRYVVRNIGSVSTMVSRGSQLNIYEATLTGLIVGGNSRPIEPPLQIFFVPTERLPSAVLLRGA